MEAVKNLTTIRGKWIDWWAAKVVKHLKAREIKFG